MYTLDSLTVQATNVAIEPVGYKEVSVTLDDVKKSDVLDHFTIDEVVEHFDEDEILAHIGIEAAKKYFGLIEEE